MAPPHSYYAPFEAGRPSGGGYAETIISDSGSYALSHASRSSRASHSQSQYGYPQSEAGSYAPSHASSRSHAPSHAGTMRIDGSDMRRSAMSNAHSQSHSHYGSEMQRYDDHQQYNGGGNGGEPFRGSLYQRDMADRAYLESERVANSMICVDRRAREEAWRNGQDVRQYTDEEYVAMRNAAGGFQVTSGGGYDDYDGRSVAEGYTQGSRRGGSHYAASQYGGYEDDDRTIVPDDSHSVAGSRGSYHSRR